MYQQSTMIKKMHVSFNLEIALLLYPEMPVLMKFPDFRKVFSDASVQ